LVLEDKSDVVVEERSLEREVAIEEKFEVSEDVRRVREI
jgi:hypothetical protein